MKTERELKLSLEKISFNVLNRYLSKKFKCETIQQFNKYYDLYHISSGAQPWYLRLRKENLKDTVRWIFTAKGSSLKKNLYHGRIEIEQELIKKPTFDHIDAFLRFLLVKNEIIISSEIQAYYTKYIGWTNNERIIIKNPIREIDELALDRTSFPDNTIDHELELEFSKDAYFESIENWSKSVFTKLKIPYVKQTLGKRARLLQHLINITKNF